VDPETAVTHFWLPGCVRRRLQCVPSAAASTTAAIAPAAANAAVLPRLLLVLL